MLQRRIVLFGLGRACIAAAIGVGSRSWAQRPTQPIARPRPPRPLMPGRFRPEAAVAAGPLPGVYVVDAVDTKADTLRLRDDSGRIGVVHVNADLFDLDSLKPGDEVEADFLVPDPGSTRLEAAGLWKVQR